MSEKIDLKNFICSIPFNSIEIHSLDYFFCCPSWLKRGISLKKYSFAEIWNSDDAIEIRNSILDGSYKYCDKELCPSLNKLFNFGIVETPIYSKNNLVSNIRKYIKNNKYIPLSNIPEFITLNFDRSCNFKCPSCRKELIMSKDDDVIKIEDMLKELEDVFSEKVKILCITGSGDPFASSSFRKFLVNFNSEKYKSLSLIHLYTNASLWNKKMWNTMPQIHKYVRTCEISIDAATKKTYENTVRINGNWDNLIDNLNFINTIKTLTEIKASFVVQKSNYKEMDLFTEIMYNIFGNKVKIFFGRITNWGTFTEDEFKQINVCDSNHEEHELFVNEFNKVWMKPRVYHNMSEFIQLEKRKTLI